MSIIQDPIVEEIRKIRIEHAAKCNNNIDDIVKDIQSREKKYGTRLVSRSPKMKLHVTET